MRAARRIVSVISTMLAVFFMMIRWCAAAPLYGPEMPARWRAHVGLETNQVLRTDMRKGLGEARSGQYFLNASCGVTDWFSLDGKLGIGSMEFDTRESGHFDLTTGFAGGYGCRLRVYDDQEARTRAILGFQHICVHPRQNVVDTVKHSSIWDEWQFSLLASRGIGRFEPYVGIKASQLYIIRKDRFSDGSSWNGAKNHFGIIGGTAIDITKSIFCVVEARFIDETAVTAAVNYKL